MELGKIRGKHKLFLFFDLLFEPHFLLVFGTLSVPIPSENARRNALRPRENIKAWIKMVWFKNNVYKHVFNFWIANLDRLSVKKDKNTK